MDTMEPPYTVKEVAALTGFSVQTVIRIFEHERGVIIYEEKRLRKRASYRTIRIPVTYIGVSFRSGRSNKQGPSHNKGAFVLIPV